MRLTAKYRRR